MDALGKQGGHKMTEQAKQARKDPPVKEQKKTRSKRK